MKFFTSMKTLALVAGMLLAGTASSEAKIEKPSSGNVVISKVFYAGSTRLNGATPKNYMLHLYVELYNNSADEVDLQGMYVAFANSDAAANAWTAADMTTENGMSGKAVVKQIFQISPDASYVIQPGQSVVITNSAIDHSQIAEGNVDLSTADFEAKSQNKSFADFHNEAVPELKMVATIGTTDFINFLNPGPCGIVLLASDTDISNKTFAKGKDSGNEYTVVPMYKSIDCVDIVKQKTPSAEDKRFTESYDAGFCVTDSIGTFNGQAVVRKTAFIASNGRVVLYDTNNSSVDFVATNDLSLRTYSQEVSGMSDSTLTIPESGFVAVNIDKPFCGPKDLYFSYVNASNNAATTDLTYYNYPGDSLLLIKGPWIAVGKPGTYTIKLSESQGVMKVRSSGMAWADEDTKTLTGSKASNMIYKFQNEKGNVGFKRVAAVGGKYNTATFSDGDRLYYAISTAIADKIAAANGATNNADLDFIAWHGVTPELITNDIACVQVKADVQKQAIFNLQGQKLVRLQKGLNIVNGKKIIVK